MRCGECGKRFEIKYDGKIIYTDSKCDVPGGLKPWALELEVPSGKLVFRNDMRDIFPSDEAYSFDVNSTHGTKACEEHYAKLGMFHVFVGNTCPSIYVFPDGRVIVGHLFDEDKRIPKKYSKVKKAGFICTDLWWFSACDYDEFVKRSGGGPDKVGWVPDVIVELPGPGRYKLTSYYSASNDPDKLKEYAIIEKL